MWKSLDDDRPAQSPTRSAGPWVVAAALILFVTPVWAGSVAAFGHEGNLPSGSVQDVNARSLHVLQYHPYPDSQGDPYGVPYEDINGTTYGYMEATYQAYWFPTVVIDGIGLLEGATSFLETFNLYEATLLERVEIDAPVRIGLTGGLMAERAALRVHVEPKGDVGSDAMDLRIVLFEDDVKFEGGNGVENHRFTVRHILNETTVAWGPGGNYTRDVVVPVRPDWDAAKLGFVAFAVNRDPDSNLFAEGEVVQAATWLVGQQGPTIQASRGVLLEGYTATWCPACVYGDGAIDELANAYGVPSSRILDRDWTYLRPWDPLVVGATLGFGLVAAVALPWASRRLGP